MFTGLIKEKGKVVSSRNSASGLRLTVEAPLLAPGANIGDSVCVSGACLTVSGKKGNRLDFDVSRESVEKTNLKILRAGTRVNLEDALTPSSPIGGHYVMGHIDGVGLVTSRGASGNSVRMEIKIPGELMKYMVPKGSIAVDGVSLTINEISGENISVNLIPHTLRSVTLGDRKKNDTVNIEVDILAKIVERMLDGMSINEAKRGKRYA